MTKAVEPNADGLSVLTEVQRQEMTEEEFDNSLWETARPCEEQWESLKADESKWAEQVTDDDETQTGWVCRK